MCIRDRVSTPDNNLVISTILRAGLPFHQGFLSYFDGAENAFVSAYRKYKDCLLYTSAFAYAIDKLQDRGKFFIFPQDEVYAGQVVGDVYKRQESDSSWWPTPLRNNGITEHSSKVYHPP